MKMTQAELRRYFNGIKSRELRSLERKLNMLRNTWSSFSVHYCHCLADIHRAGSCVLLRPSSHSHHCGVTACRSMVCVTFPAEVIMSEWIKDIVAGILFFIAMGMLIVLMALVFPDPTLWK